MVILVWGDGGEGICVAFGSQEIFGFSGTVWSVVSRGEYCCIVSRLSTYEIFVVWRVLAMSGEVAKRYMFRWQLAASVYSG